MELSIEQDTILQQILQNEFKKFKDISQCTDLVANSSRNSQYMAFVVPPRGFSSGGSCLLGCIRLQQHFRGS